MKKVISVLCLDDFPYLGGAQVAMLRLVDRGARDTECGEATLVAPGGASLEETARRVRGLHFEEAPIHRLKGPGLPLGHWLRTWRTLRRLLAGRKVTLIHANSLWAYLVALPVAVLARVPLVVSIHASPHVVTPWKRRVFSVLGRWLFWPAARIVVVSEALRVETVALLGGAERTVVVPNGVDAAELKAPGMAMLPEGWTGRPVVGMFGRLHPRKGQGVFVEAIRLLHRRGRTEVRGLIVGGECAMPLERLDYRARLEAESAELGAAIHFTGEVSRVGPWMRCCAVVVLPSEEETFGLTLIEAGALGLPVIASRVGGVPEVVEEGITGILIPPRDPGALADAIARLLDDPVLAGVMGEGGRRRVEERFTLDRVAGRMYGIYSDVLRTR